MKILRIFFVLLFVVIANNNNAQIDEVLLEQLQEEGSFKMKFKKANSLMDKGNFEFALEIWKILIVEQPQNYNINSQIGTCYIQLGSDKKNALEYLIKAEKQIAKDYNHGSYEENDAPIDTKFYLGIAFHLNSQFDKAIERFESFRKKGGKYHKLYDAAGLAIVQANNAKELIKAKKNYLITNVGAPINGKYSDYGPAVTADGSMMFFTSKRTRLESEEKSNVGITCPLDGQHYEDVYVSYLNRKTNSWGVPEIMGFSDPNSNQASISTSPDGQFLFIKKEHKGIANLYLLEREGTGYSEPQLMVENINSKSWETGATISADGTTFYFVSDRPEGYGGGDIYRCLRLPTGEWSLPKNLGPSINSEYDEICPFIHPDGKTLFYSSNNDKSMGGFDIFKSVREGDTLWRVPENVGYPLNTVDHDVSFSTMADGKTGYFSSEMGVDGLGHQDIYKVDLDTIVIDQVSILKGYIELGNRKGLPDNIYILVSEVDSENEPLVFQPNRRSGSYIFNLTPCKEYIVEYTMDDKTFNQINITVPCNSGYQEINKVINLEGVKLKD